MGAGPIKPAENPCFRCRKEAAKYNDKLYSREGAAEQLGVSVSSLADYELGITKVIPVDKVVLMADLYRAPELKTWYCSQECPIGRSLPMPTGELTSLELTAMGLLKRLRDDDVQRVKDELIDISADGKLTDDERPKLAEIMRYLDELIRAAAELRLIGTKIMDGGG